MILIIILISLSIVFVLITFLMSKKNVSNDLQFWVTSLTIIFCVVALLSTIRYAIASYQVKVINKRLGTNYTVNEMFFAGNTIQKMIEGQKYKVITNNNEEN